MSHFLNQKLALRFLALGILVVCLTLLSRNDVNTQMPSAIAMVPSLAQTESISVSALSQPGAPLVISSPRIVSRDGQNIEVAIDMVNVSLKSIRAYAIRQVINGDVTQAGQIIFTNLDLTNKSSLQPNQLTTSFDVYQASGKQENITVFVDYVEFSDGTRWGVDSVNLAERSAGQRAAAYILSKRLLNILNNGNPADVMTAIGKGIANIEPPPGRSTEWKEGFRQGCKAIEQQLKRAQMKGGLNQIDPELRQFGQRFKGVE
jgi:hypothetical protein